MQQWHAYNEETMHGRYPIVDENKKVLGIVTSKDMIGVAKETPIDKSDDKASDYGKWKNVCRSCGAYDGMGRY